MKDRLPLVADLLMDAAHADDTLAGEEKAAVKRLLRDIGYRIGAIDAAPDKATDGALADFRKRLKLAPAATVADLFDALETEALKSATPAGYAICNDTAKSVAAAIGEKMRTDWISHGWWKIAAGSCAKVVDDLGGADCRRIHGIGHRKLDGAAFGPEREHHGFPQEAPGKALDLGLGRQ